jgi:hypothetical protein
MPSHRDLDRCLAPEGRLAKLLLLAAFVSILLAAQVTGAVRAQEDLSDPTPDAVIGDVDPTNNTVADVQSDSDAPLVAANAPAVVDDDGLVGGAEEAETPAATVAAAATAVATGAAAPPANQYPNDPCFSLFDFVLVPGPNGTRTLVGSIRGGTYDGYLVSATVSQPGRTMLVQMSVTGGGKTVATFTFNASPEQGTVNYTGGSLTVNAVDGVDRRKLLLGTVFLSFWVSPDQGVGRIYGLC